MSINSSYQNIEQLYNLAQESRKESDFSIAVACYQKILRLQPQRAEIYLELGNTLSQNRQIDEAVSAYKRAIALEPKQPAWVYQNLGQALQQQKSYPESIRAYRQALALTSQAELWVYRNLGTVLAKEKQYKKAIAIYQDLITLYPECAGEIYIKIGDIYQKQKQFFAAKSSYRKARGVRALYNINEVISCIRQYFPSDANLLDIDILDNGCDPTGEQLALLAEQTQGRVVGTNVYYGFPEQTLKRRRKNNEFYWMDGQKLTFPTESFDLVMSLNVLEHVPNPHKYLQECYRVLRPGGVGFFSWYPLWSGATGHHIHPDMVSNQAHRLGLPTPEYSLDGSSIPFWGHLLLSAPQMLSFLIEKKKYHPKLAEWMRNYIYDRNDINRWFWRDIWHSFQSLTWEIEEVEHRGKQIIPPDIKQKLESKYGKVNNFEICGAKIIVRK